MPNQTASKNNKNNAVWILILIFAPLATAAIAGIIVFVIMDGKAQTLESQLDDANRSVMDLQEIVKGVQDKSNVLEEGKKEVSTDDRELLTIDNTDEIAAKYAESIDGRPDYCSFSEKFNNDPATTTEHFEDQSLGLAVDIPYNPDWATKELRVLPYEEFSRTVISDPPQGLEGSEETNAGISYGPFTVFEGCGWIRTGGILVTEQRSTQEAIDAIKDLYGSGGDPTFDPFIVEPVVDQVGALTVVKHNAVGLCGNATIEVIGDDYNYVFTSLCADDFDELEDIVKSVELI